MALIFNPYILGSVELTKKVFLKISHLNVAILKIYCSKGRALMTTNEKSPNYKKFETKTILAPHYHVSFSDCMSFCIFIDVNNDFFLEEKADFIYIYMEIRKFIT